MTKNLPGGKIETFKSKNPFFFFSPLRCWILKHKQLCDEIHACHSYSALTFVQPAILPTTQNLIRVKLKLSSQTIPSPFFFLAIVFD
jgi:hypothetical protein